MKFDRSLWLAGAATFALLPVLAAPAFAGPRPVGPEFRVNLTSEFKQLNPQAAYNNAGQALVVWENPQHGIRGIYYNSNGQPVGAEMSLVPNQTLGAIPARGDVVSRKEPALALLPNGEFFLFWTEERAFLSVDYFIEDRDIHDRDILGQRFSPLGTPVGERFKVNTTDVGFQAAPKAIVRNGGDMIVIWGSDDRQRGIGEGDGFYAQIVSRAGRLLGNEIKIATLRDAAIKAISLAADAQGDFIVTWESCCLDGDNLGVVARLYDKTGAPRGGEFVVNTDRVGRQRRPAVAADRSGKGFLVTWQGFVESPVELQSRIFGQFVGSAGNLVGPQFKISTGTFEDVQISPSVALLPSGNFLVTWMSWIKSSPIGVLGVEVDATGNLVGREFAVSTGKIYPQYRTALAVSKSGEAFSAWQAADGRRKMSIVGRRLDD